MQTKYKLLITDLGIQTLLIILLIIVACSKQFLTVIEFLIFLGGWQVLSAFILLLGYKELTRIGYFLMVILSFLMLRLLESDMSVSNELNLVILLSVISPFIGLFYYGLTCLDLRQLKKEITSK